MDQGQVKRRRVFYIPGFDPNPPRRYRELYRTESAAQSAISGYEVAITPKAGETYGWRVEACMDAHTVHADVEVLVWSDIVRNSMASTLPATYLQLVRTAWIYIASGTLHRLMWLRKGPVIGALYPVAMLLLQLGVAIAVGSILGRIAVWGLALSGGAMRAVYWPIMLVAAVQVLRWFKSIDGRFFAHYLMHDYAFSAQLNGAYPPELEARMATFAATIRAALQTDVDEVLVVGHSSGAHLAVSVLSDLIRAGGVHNDGPGLGFLSLGHVVPMVSFLPKAHRLRADLAYLSTRDELTWIDVSAPGDGCAFALCDPVAVSGVAPAGKKWPLVISAAFTQTLSPDRWRDLRWRFFRLHFQYLCAFDRPGAYDYFRITAGPMTLADRFGGRAPSKLRIDVRASKYTSLRQ